MELEGAAGFRPGIDPAISEVLLDLVNDKGIDFSSPYVAETYDAVAIATLAMQAAKSKNPEIYKNFVTQVTNSDGTKIYAGELSKGLQLIADGQAVDYVGASSVELDYNGDDLGDYILLTAVDGIWKNLAAEQSVDVTLTVRDRDGDAVSGFDVLGIEQADAEELYFDFGKTESGAFDVSLMAKPIATTENFYFQIEDQNTVSGFELGSAVSNWSTSENTVSSNGITTVTASGVGTGLSANVEHELANFTSSGDGLNLELTEGRLREEIQDTVSLVADIETTDETGVARYNFSSSSDVLISAEEGYENAFPNDHVNELDALQLMKKLLPGSNETMSQADMIASDFNRDGKVDTMDIKAILEYTVGLAGSKEAEWALVTDDDLTGNTTSNVDYDLDITLSNLTSDISIDATAILIGDVNNSFV